MGLQDVILRYIAEAQDLGLALAPLLPKLHTLVGGSWVVISGVISRITLVITRIRGLITPLTTTHEPPSKALLELGRQKGRNLRNDGSGSVKASPGPPPVLLKHCPNPSKHAPCRIAPETLNP